MNKIKIIYILITLLILTSCNSLPNHTSKVRITLLNGVVDTTTINYRGTLTIYESGNRTKSYTLADSYGRIYATNVATFTILGDSRTLIK